MLIYLQMIEGEADRSKFLEIYLKYRELLFYLARRRLENEQDAEDAVHQVYVKAAEHIRHIRPPCPETKRYLVVTLENTVTDMLRKRSRVVELEYTEAGPAGSVPPTEGGSLLEDCVLRLPEKQRAVIWLKYDQGYSLRETAQILGISLAAAQKLDQRAKARLRELYLEGGGSL